MLRPGRLIAILWALSACATHPPEQGIEAVQGVAIDSALEKDIDIFSTYAVAKYAGLTEEPHLSADHFKKLVQDVPSDPWVAEQAVFSVLRLGDMQSAIDIAQALEPAILAQTELPRLTLAVAALKTGDDIETLTQLGATWHSRFNAIMARGLAAWAALDTDPDAAISIQSRASPQTGIYTLISQSLAAVMKASTGRKADALKDLEILSGLPPRLAMSVETRARLLALSGNTERARALIEAYHREGRHHPALTALAAEIQTGQVSAFKPLSASEGAARVLYQYTTPQAREAYGDIAAVYFTLAHFLDPDYYAIHAQWAHTLDYAGRRTEAIRLLESIPPDSLHYISAQGQLAWALLREQRHEEALSVARQTVYRTNDRHIRIQLADLLQTVDKDGEADAIFTEIIDTDEAEGVYDWRIYFERGKARERLGYWPLAENDLKTALTLNPDNPAILNYLGYSWIDRGIHLDEGLKLVQKALQLAPDSGAITDSLGWAHYKLGNYEQAVHYLERASALAPDISEILDHLGDTYWQVGRFKDAGFQWQRALQFSQDPSERARLEQKLETGLVMQSAAITHIQPAYP